MLKKDERWCNVLQCVAVLCRVWQCIAVCNGERLSLWATVLKAPESCLDVWHDFFMFVTWLVRGCDMTRLYVWFDSFIRMTRLGCMCDTTRLFVLHDSFVCVTRVTWRVWHESTHENDTTHSHLAASCGAGSLMCVTRLTHTLHKIIRLFCKRAL